MAQRKVITVPVRISAEEDRRIKLTARRLRTSAAAIVRLAIASQLRDIETGAIKIPDIAARAA